ncbi:C4-dicarboxylate-binding periplasmic protein precursor (plasmid) [Sulfitobacter sp. THAF37]|uniref:TRAP transporter substrate-binding protein n=1 Tax=Sulfitobacter sp. THAF37 TaxID=2587855 RepID=UPI0012690CCB|nr:TRAP transporter substrate-binding protein [Sulfitobacter sp. THAF37]QFT60755.1 C4-dicarboxylate-binding periplasmic protein precursor [Sulfitobacter sp. THAF37]
MVFNRRNLGGRLGRGVMGYAAALVLTLLAGQTAQAQESLRFTTSVPAPSFIYADILSVWAQRVIDDSNGTLDIQMFPAGTLGRDPATHLDMARDGIADISYIILGYTPGAVNEATIIELPGSVPSATAGSLAATKMVEDGLWPGQGMENVKVLGAFSTAPTLLTTLSKVETLDDAAGKKLRGAGPTLLATINAIGATPVGGITSPQLAESLSRGLIDGTINEWVALTIFGVAEIAKYHLDINLGASPLMVVMNKDRYDSLPEEARAAIDKNSGEPFARLWGEEFDAAIEKFRSAAMKDDSRTFTTLSDEQQAIWDDKLQTVVDGWIAETPNGQEIYDAFTAAVNEAAQ